MNTAQTPPPFPKNNITLSKHNTMSTPPPSIAAHLPSDLKPSPSHSFNPATAIPLQTGKVFLITGATSGIGRQTALQLAAHEPAQLWLCGRDLQKGAELVAAIKDVDKGVDARFVEMDLASFESVKRAAEEIIAAAKGGQIHVLMMNAGIVRPPRIAGWLC
jgi:retinol dehydrogenase-12